MVIMKRILLSHVGGVLLSILNFVILTICPPESVVNGTIQSSPFWVEVIALPLRYGVRLNRHFFPPIDQSFILFRWSDVAASFLGAFLFFGILTYIFLLYWTKRLRMT